MRTESKLYPECGARLKNFHSSSTVLCICPSLFETNVNKAKYSIYGKLSTVLSVAGIQFSTAPKALVFGNLFKLFRLAVTFAREVCHLGIKMTKDMTIVIFFSLSPIANCPCKCEANLTRLNKLPNRRFFDVAENGSVEVLEMVALFLLKKGTFGAKNR